MNKNTNNTYAKQCLIRQVKKISEEKKKKIGTHILCFEKEDINDLGGAFKLGYYIHILRDKVYFEEWMDVPALTLVKIKDLLIKERFYSTKIVKNKEVKVRLRRN